MPGLSLKAKVRMEYVHLIFVGEKTFKTFDEALRLIEEANNNGAGKGLNHIK